LEAHYRETVNGHTIAEPLQQRFRWLSAGDSRVYQELLNHFLMQDRRTAVDHCAGQILIVLRELVVNPGAIQPFTRELRVGCHKVSVVYDPQQPDVRLTTGAPDAWRPESATEGSAIAWIVGIAIVLFIFWICSGAGRH